MAVPYYLTYLGAEAYGLIGFYSILQLWYNVLDLGLNSAISRQSTRLASKGIEPIEYKKIFRAVLLVSIGISFLGFSCLYIGSEYFGENWFKSSSITTSIITNSLRLMSIAVVLRWFGGLFRGVMIGFEKNNWLSLFSVIIATLRFIVVFWTMKAFGCNLIIFFTHQALVALVEVLALAVCANKLISKYSHNKKKIGWSILPIKSIAKFSFGIAFSGVSWVLITQFDKFLISTVLPLDEFGVFSIAVLLAGGISILTQPLTTVMAPRLTKACLNGDRPTVIKEYRTFTKNVVLFAGSGGIMLAVFAKPILFLYTGINVFSEKGEEVLRLYAIGNLIAAINMLPFYLQYGFGQTRYLMFGSMVSGLILVPSLYLVTSRYGGQGAAWVWLLFNISSLVIWSWIVHQKFIGSVHLKWLFYDVICVLIIPFIVVITLGKIVSIPDDRIFAGIVLFCIGSTALGLGSLTIRKYMGREISLEGWFS